MFKAQPSDEPRWSQPKGTWRGVETEEKLTATFACPDCGATGTLEDHEIHADGKVEPSVICPDECGFHDIVVLENWHGRNGVEKITP